MFKLCDRCLYESGFIAESTTHLINLCILHYVNSFAKFLALLLHNTSPPSKALFVMILSLVYVCISYEIQFYPNLINDYYTVYLRKVQWPSKAQ